ncbi:MAG: 1-deoxy-D-xylulose-5-phosphate reductoisomerase [Desulfobulbaceae bacterium]|nr:1-deoxy-D-xylulose-5-phosphate reductoisomerase [Desulfobulbaceae bacterium]
MKNISLLGSTGSIGKNVLEVVRKFPDFYRIRALSAGRNIELLAAQIREFRPELISVAFREDAAKLAAMLPSQYSDIIYCGEEGNVKVASFDRSDTVVTAVVGAVGLVPTLAAIKAGKNIGLANKETLVMAGRLVMQSALKNNVRILPIDSEHNAIFQALEAGRREDVARIILTASGGPFRGKSAKELVHVNPTEALAHPNWDMGQKISIDSATLMNKGLEVIEARWLFDVEVDAINVVVHPQSIVHSLVEYVDGSVVAQLGVPDMKIPIAYALSYPKRLDLGLSRLSLSQCGRLDFEKPDHDRFPALKLAYKALELGGVMPAVLNGANEVAVAAFLAEEIGFTDIAALVARTMDGVQQGDEMVLEEVLLADQRAREFAQQEVQRIRSGE